MRLSPALALVPTLLCACGGGTPSRGPAPAGSGPGASPEAVAGGGAVTGTLRFGIDADAETFDPCFQNTALDGALIQQIMEPLVWYDNDLNMIPWLATSWEATNEARTFTFHLKPGVAFHCGEPFGADAVARHFRRILDTPGSTRRERIAQVASIEVTGDLTVRFELSEPYARFPEVLRDPFAHIVCPRHAEERGQDFARHPCGTGPFVFEAWQPEVRIRMRRHPAWHGGTVGFEELVFIPMPEETTRVIELLAGNLEMCVVSWNIVNDLRQRYGDEIEVQAAPSLSVRYIAFNTQKPPFSDVRMRRAANLAVNQQEIIDHLMNGVGTVSHGPLPPNMPDYNPDMVRYDYSPGEARRLMAEAGYPGGVDVLMWSDDRQTFSTIANAVVEDLRQVGIRVRLQTFDRATYWGQFDRYIPVSGPWDPTGEGVYDMAIAGWVGGESPFGFLKPLFTSNSYSNSAFYSNPEMDAILTAMNLTLDPDEYHQLALEAQRIIAEDAPWLFCSHGVEGIALRPNVRGYVINPGGEFRFDGVSVAAE